ncbi:unnamed protein product [Adineta ricciae]|uniref:Teneurin NHL domain-containing protein n=1 Tax=Adineta ricciae TaxID=249248 RepID=A0A814QT06_ADIRI|nr:unnamed protein product [Adineta ricciae]CAF1356765.1 unnamed protein product [Adineta ricciae]
MATSTSKVQCVTCAKDKGTVQCHGCSQSFCFKHLTDHRQQLNQQFDEIEMTRDLFRQTLTEYSNNLQKHLLIKEIDRWEQDSINLIRKTAEEARQHMHKHTTEHLSKMEKKLNDLTKQLKEGREDDDFVEIDLQQWNQQLTQMNEELMKPTNIKVKQSSTPLIRMINVEIFDKDLSSYNNIDLLFVEMTNISANTKWMQNGVTVAGGHGKGNGLNQLNNPISMCIDENQTIYVADYNNHRIVEWKKGATIGRIVADGNGQGDRNDQLHRPISVVVDEKTDSLIISDYDNRRIMRWSRQNGTSGQVIISGVRSYGIAMDSEGYLYVSDCEKSEVRRWKVGDKSGEVVAGGNGGGNQFDQLNGPYGVFVDKNHSVYVVDTGNHRVMKWVKGAREGIVVAGGQGQGNSLSQLNCPYGVVVDQLGSVYVADQCNHRIMRWCVDSREGNVIVGGNGGGQGTNQLHWPLSLLFDEENNLYVVDRSNHRIQKFNIDVK